jgi:hypothetical protein
MTITLKRISANQDATFGVLIKENTPFAVTLERPWLDNTPNLSCIPVGIYQCKRLVSPHFGRTYEVTGVYSREHILFHAGNTEKDTQGCIIVAEEFGQINGKGAVLDSKKGFNEFLSIVQGVSEFELTITEV